MQKSQGDVFVLTKVGGKKNPWYHQNCQLTYKAIVAKKILISLGLAGLGPKFLDAM